MAKNKPRGKGREGTVSNRSQFLDRLNGLWVKRNLFGGKFVDVKTTGGRFKGVRREK